MAEYGIPPDEVNGHGLIDGESTKCPGRNFPMAALREAIA